uniref:NP-Bra-2 n=1 Tax=Brachyurophis roperi TaxID=1295043 RepID=R4G2E1_9SAUR
MLGLARLAGGGLLLLLLLALLPLALDGKPAPLPQALPKAPAGGTTASRRELTEQQQPPSPAEESSGPAAGRSGSKAAKIELDNGCFGVRLDRIGTSSGLGCKNPVENAPTPTPAGS